MHPTRDLKFRHQMENPKKNISMLEPCPCCSFIASKIYAAISITQNVLWVGLLKDNWKENSHPYVGARKKKEEISSLITREKKLKLKVLGADNSQALVANTRRTDKRDTVSFQPFYEQDLNWKWLSNFS